MADGDSANDDEAFRAPLPPEDRLWRHPSELAAESAAAPGSRRGAWRPLMGALAGGVCVVGALWFLTGGDAGDAPTVTVAGAEEATGSDESTTTTTTPAASTTTLASTSTTTLVAPSTTLAAPTTSGHPADPLETARRAGPDPWLGVTLRDADDGAGATVTEIVPGGPADHAGIEVDDRIVDVGGAAVTSTEDAVSTLHEHEPGAEVAVRLQRAGGESTVIVALGNRPAD